MRLPEVPSILSYQLTEEQVDIFFDTNTPMLKKGWRDNLRTVIGDKNRYCVLKIGYNHVTKINSNKKKSSAFKIKATCKYPS